ncbi:MAG TPA: transcriptional regulator, partial [Coriobacteriia bacterium]|nr:transcriptional regulator [Coriobacteriia bacterium]
VEMSRLRRLFPGCLDAERYALAVELDSDAEHVRRALRAGSIRLAAERYRGCLLERSEAPGVVRQRDELDGWVRNAVLTSDDCDAMWHWVQTSSGDQDLMAWSRLLGALPYDDARRPKVAAHLGALRQELQTPV